MCRSHLCVFSRELYQDSPTSIIGQANTVPPKYTFMQVNAQFYLPNHNQNVMFDHIKHKKCSVGQPENWPV